MFLEKIIASTRRRVDAQKRGLPLATVRERALNQGPLIGAPFAAAMSRPELSFICEVKKASPSKGLIAADFDALAIAESYAAAGAEAISVLTEPEFFQGSPDYLAAIASRVPLPVLRKDFIIDEYQVYEARLLGASAVLLICAALSDSELASLLNLASGLGLSALVEVHDEAELEQAVMLGAQIIGINNRDLKSFTVDLDTTLRLGAMLPPGTLLVAESGITTPADIAHIVAAKPAGVLIGEALMRAADKTAALAGLRTAAEAAGCARALGSAA